MEQKFKTAWQINTTQCPPIKKIFKIIENKSFLLPYDRYKFVYDLLRFVRSPNVRLEKVLVMKFSAIMEPRGGAHLETLEILSFVHLQPVPSALS